MKIKPIDARVLMKKVTATVTVKNVREVTIRLKLVYWLFRLASWISPIPVIYRCEYDVDKDDFRLKEWISQHGNCKYCGCQITQKNRGVVPYVCDSEECYENHTRDNFWKSNTN
jgi:hypothetical protein